MTCGVGTKISLDGVFRDAFGTKIRFVRVVEMPATQFGQMPWQRCEILTRGWKWSREQEQEEEEEEDEEQEQEEEQ